MPRPIRFLARAGIPIVTDLDTRALVRHLRTRGVMRGVLSAIEKRRRRSWSKRRAAFPPWPASISPAASPPPSATSGPRPSKPCSPSELIGRRAEPRFHVVAYDFGIKHNILRRLVQAGCRVTVVPALTTAEDVLALKPDGIFLSNGPGDPEPLVTAGRQHPQAHRQEAHLRHLPRPPVARPRPRRQDLQAEVRPSRRQPSGAQRAHRTRRDHLPQSRLRGRSDSLNLNEVEITHVNLNDQTLEGFRHRSEPVFCVQYHPEAAPGPHDSHYLFDDFVKLMREAK